jgi:hypothetical protein
MAVVSETGEPTGFLMLLVVFLLVLSLAIETGVSPFDTVGVPFD